MKKQVRRISKLGPCVKKMRHRFLKGDGIPVGFNMVIKRCVNCRGQFWMHARFQEGMRNLAPAPDEIKRRLLKIAEELRLDKVTEERKAAARTRTVKAKAKVKAKAQRGRSAA